MILNSFVCNIEELDVMSLWMCRQRLNCCLEMFTMCKYCNTNNESNYAIQGKNE